MFNFRGVSLWRSPFIEPKKSAAGGNLEATLPKWRKNSWNVKLQVPEVAKKNPCPLSGTRKHIGPTESESRKIFSTQKCRELGMGYVTFQEGIHLFVISRRVSSRRFSWRWCSFFPRGDMLVPWCVRIPNGRLLIYATDPMARHQDGIWFWELNQ